MALGFFRRRQKMVIIIMVVLMVSFLIGFQGFEMIFHRNLAKESVGTASFGKVTRQAIQTALDDLQLLKYLGFESGIPLYTAERYAYLVRGNPSGAALAYALLAGEAEQGGARVSRAEVEDFFDRLGRDYDEVRSNLPKGWTESRMRQSVSRWVLINKTFDAAVVDAPPTEPQLRHLYRDLAESIDLRVAKLSAADFVKDIPEPALEEISAFFQEYRTIEPGEPTEKNPMGFGFKQPARAKIAYLVINQEAVQRAAVPDEQAIIAHYRKHKDRYVKPATQPASAPATSDAATQPVEVRLVQMGPAEARPQIIRELSAAVASQYMDDLAQAVRKLLDQRANSASGPAAADFGWVRRQLMRPADDVLARQLKDVNIVAQRLDEAVEALAEKAGLAAIVYPWGQHGDLYLSPSVKVTVTQQSITLGEALESITRQVVQAPQTQPATASAPADEPPAAVPTFEWAMMSDVATNALFAVGGAEGVDLFPVSAGQTDMLTSEQLRMDPTLGMSRTTAGKSLAEVAFTSRPVIGQSADAGALDIGEEGPRMYSFGDYVFWALLDATPAKDATSEDLKSDPELAKRVLESLKTQKAFEVALRQAEDLKTMAAQTQLESAAAARGLGTVTTGLFSRKRVADFPDAFDWSFVPELRVAPQKRPELIGRLFELAPADVEPPYEDLPPALMVIPLAGERQVAVVQRVGFRPAVESEYERSKDFLINRLNASRYWEALSTWFALPSIEQRVAFEVRKDLAPAGGEAEEDEQ